MAYDVKLPDIGEGVAEGEIVRWLVRVGDPVTEDQPLVEVMTDKASVEIPSPRTGSVQTIHVEEGAMVPVGTTIISIAVAGEVVAVAPSEPLRSAVTTGAALAAMPPTAAAAGGRVEATPAVRALAKDLAVSLESIRGSGVNGRITADDVRVAAGQGAPPAGAAPTLPPAAAPGPESRLALRGLRRRIAEHMRRSLSTAAQFTFVAECDFTALVEHRTTAKPAADAAGVKLTYLAYLFRALPAVLQQFPLLNSSLDEATHEIVLKGYYHLGLATNTDEGLTVPIVRNADRLSLFEIAREIDRLAVAARDHKLTLEELRGGTFTVTSTGTKGGLLATPILHHPQVAILGMHSITKKPAVVQDQIVARDLGNLSLSLDHRVVDGAVGADFMYALIEKLQTPNEWLTAGDLS
ncbi:MAG: dihydrolipoamide acetyltransferase family protein [Candidatus Eisenbacteria bacterium]